LARHFNLLPVFFTLIVAFTFSCSRSPETVAKVGSEKITVTEFREALKARYPDHLAESIPLENRRDVINFQMEKRVKYLEARERGYNKDTDFKRSLKRREERLIAAKLSELLITNKLVPQEMARAFLWLKWNKADVIIIGIGYQNSDYITANRTKEDAIKLAQQYYQDIFYGTDPEILAGYYSDDPYIKHNNGKFRSYQPGLFHPAVDLAIYQTPVNIVTHPVITDRGIFIIKVLNKKELHKNFASPEDLNRTKRSIYQAFFKHTGDSLYRNISLDLRKKLGGEISDSGINEFLLAVKDWSAQSDTADSTFTRAQRSIILGKVGNFSLTAGHIIDEFQGTFISSYQKFNNPPECRKMIDEYINNYLVWLIEGRHSKLDHDGEIRLLMKLYEIDQMVTLFDKNVLQKQTQPNQEEIDAYYSTHQQEYKQPARLELWQIALKEEKKAREVAALARKRPDQFDKLVQKYTDKEGQKNSGGYLGYVSKNSPREVAKEAFEKGPNSIIGPVEEFNYYYVVKTGKLRSERQRDLSEVLVSVKAKIQQQKKEQLWDKILKDFQKNHLYWINEKDLQKIV
jgi:parvulin-like peptidyl-prolyl isomerase